MPRRARGYWIERAPSGVWRIAWTDARVKRTKSLGTRDQGQAERALREFLDELANPIDSSSPTLEQVLDGYAADRQPHVADYSRIDLCIRHLKRHLGWLLVSDIRPAHSKQYDKLRRQDGVHAGTIIRELRTLRAALRWAESERHVDRAPTVWFPPAPESRDRWLSRGEADALIRGCVSFHVRLFVVIALHTGARRSAILGLAWTQVDMEARLIRFGAGRAKKGRATVPINQTLLRALREAREAAQTPYVIEYRRDRVRSVKHALRRAYDRAGIEGATAHTLRHTAATWMSQAGVPMRKIALYLGHKSEETTAKIYAHHSPDYLKEASEALEG